MSLYVSVNSNWVHPRATPGRLFWVDRIPATRAIFCLRPCSHGYDIVPFRFGPFQKVVRRGVAFTPVRKKSSGPFQNTSRNWAVRKSEPEIGTIRYRTVPLSCEQKRYDIVPLSGPASWYLRAGSTGDTKLVSMTKFDVEVEMRSNCTSLILPIVSSFQNRPFTSTVYSS